MTHVPRRIRTTRRTPPESTITGPKKISDPKFFLDPKYFSDRRPRYLWKTRIGWRFGLLCNVKNIFVDIMAQDGSIFKPILHENHQIKMVSLITKKGTNRVKKLMKILFTNVKNCLQTQNCGETKPDWAKRLFIPVSITPNWVESGETTQAPKLFFPSVIKKNLCPQSLYGLVRLNLKVNSDFWQNSSLLLTAVAFSTTSKLKKNPKILKVLEA